MEGMDMKSGEIFFVRIQQNICHGRKYILLSLIVGCLCANRVIEGWTITYQSRNVNNFHYEPFLKRHRHYLYRRTPECANTIIKSSTDSNDNQNLPKGNNTNAVSRNRNDRKTAKLRTTLEVDIQKKLLRDQPESALPQSKKANKLNSTKKNPQSDKKNKTKTVAKKEIDVNVLKNDQPIEAQSTETQSKENKSMDSSNVVKKDAESRGDSGSSKAPPNVRRYGSNTKGQMAKTRSEITSTKGFANSKFASNKNKVRATEKGSGKKMFSDQFVNGLSSWEEFLGGNSQQGMESGKRRGRNSPSSSLQAPTEPASQIQKKKKAVPSRIDNVAYRKNEKVFAVNPAITSYGEELSSLVSTEATRQRLLPSIEELFPLDLSFSSTADQQLTLNSRVNIDTNRLDTVKDSTVGIMVSPFALDGISPVSDLFYRSSQSQNQEDDNDDDDDGIEHDDEELPFSAEQSDAVTSEHNKIRIRRNMVLQRSEQVPSPPTNRQYGRGGNNKQKQDDNLGNSRKGMVGVSNSTTTSTTASAGGRSRKMVRRGMEMLVGGVPINADPPQRSLELFYDAQKYFDTNGSNSDWARVISLNTRDFGPIRHSGSSSKLSLFEQALYCESFCDSCIKWDVCPADFRSIIHDFESQRTAESANAIMGISTPERPNSSPSTITDEDTSILFGEALRQIDDVADSSKRGKTPRQMPRTKGKGFSRSILANRDSSGSDRRENDFYQTQGEFMIEIGVSKDELEFSDPNQSCIIVKDVLVKAFSAVMERALHGTQQEEEENFEVDIIKLSLEETDDGYTSVSFEYRVIPVFNAAPRDMERNAKRISSIFTQAMDDGDIAVAIAAAARDESRWPLHVRNRVIEECLFQEDDGDGPLNAQDDEIDEPPIVNTVLEKTSISAVNDKDILSDISLNSLVLSSNSSQSSADLFHNAGVDGIFPDYSAANARNAPYGGLLGPRLVHAADERARQRQPRVIAVGDVHGCIDEFQDLLRLCDYCPGDLVVLLGDLVCKGPDSISVVQMAREIGAIGVRGNHDFEVIRWHQAIKSGVDPPIVGSEHFHIASCLSKADMKWLYSLPWYISSKELGCLFVHAGFVSGIRLAKQNPRLMMNMRSILPDGTVTSKFFNNWPWARLWDGPQTVLFGHDADRGLQQYEHALGLDTGCVYGGRLTACILPEKRLVSVSARREYFKYRRKHYD